MAGPGQFSCTPPADTLPLYRPALAAGEQRLRKSSARPSTSWDPSSSAAFEETAVASRQKQASNRRPEYAPCEFYLQLRLHDDPTATKSRDYFATSARAGHHEWKAYCCSPESKPEGGEGRYATELDVEYVLSSPCASMKRSKRGGPGAAEKYRSEREGGPHPRDVLESPRNGSGSCSTRRQGSSRREARRYLAGCTAHHQFHRGGGREVREISTSRILSSGARSRTSCRIGLQACIQYYYAGKKELNLKDKLKKQPRRRKKAVASRGPVLVRAGQHREQRRRRTRIRAERRTEAPAAPRPPLGAEATPTGDSEGERRLPAALTPKRTGCDRFEAGR